MSKKRWLCSCKWFLLLMFLACSEAEEASQQDETKEVATKKKAASPELPVLPNPNFDEPTAHYLNSWSQFQELLSVIDLTSALSAYLDGGSGGSKMFILNNTYQGLLYKVKVLKECLYRLIQSPRLSKYRNLRPVKSRVALLQTYVLRLDEALTSEPHLEDENLINLVSMVYVVYGYLTSEVIRDNTKRYTQTDLGILTSQ